MLSCLPTHMVSQTRFVAERRARGLHPIDELQRFRLLVTVLCCSICISMIYVFDMFTKSFREQFHLSAGDLSTVSTIGVSVCWFVLPYSFVFNRFGPTPMFAAAMAVGFTGNLCLALVFRGVIAGSLANISVFYAMICAASGMLDSSTIVTLAEVFPRNRGLVIGLAKVMTGLGSSMWASLSRSVFHHKEAPFLFFIMSLLVCVCAGSLCLVRLPPYFITPWRRQRMDPAAAADLELLKIFYHKKNVPLRRLAVGFAIVTAFIIFFTVATPLKAYTHISYGSDIVLGTITIALFLCFFIMTLPIRLLGGVDEPAPVESDGEGKCAPLALTPSSLEQLNAPSADELDAEVPALGGGADGKGKALTVGQPCDELCSGEVRLTVEPAAPADERDDDDATAEQREARRRVAEALQNTRQDPRYGGSLVHNLLKPDVWPLLFGFAFQSAIGNMVLYNSSTISVAINGFQRSNELSALYTAFLGVGSALGRIAMGSYEAYVQHQDPDHRRFLVTMVLPLPPILAVVACLLLLFLPGKAILLPFLIVYFEEGFFNAIRAIIYPCIFESHHPVYYNMSFMSSIISVVCFNRLLFGFTVDKQHDKLGYAPGEDCAKRECVRVPIIVACAVAALAAVMQTVVHLRYSRFVRRTREKIRQQREEALQQQHQQQQEETLPEGDRAFTLVE